MDFVGRAGGVLVGLFLGGLAIGLLDAAIQRLFGIHLPGLMGVALGGAGAWWGYRGFPLPRWSRR